MLHAPASQQAQNTERVIICAELHVPSSRQAGNIQRIVIRAANFKNALRASVTKSSGHREGRHLCREFGERSTCQCYNKPRKSRGSSYAPRISKTPRMSRMLHAPASRQAGTTERVVICAENLENAPRGSVTTNPENQEGRHVRREWRTLHVPALQQTQNTERVGIRADKFRGRSARQRDFEESLCFPLALPRSLKQITLSKGDHPNDFL